MNLSEEYLKSLVRELIAMPKETEWIEFKHNNDDPKEIGEYISALSNSAALCGKASAYLLWGIENSTHAIIGTEFEPYLMKKGNEELENWLLRLLSPRLAFHFNSLYIDGKKVVILEIPRSTRVPVQFEGREYIRVGSYKKNIKDYPEIERELWLIFNQTFFEEMIALERVSDEDVLKYLDYPAFVDSLGLSFPEDRAGILKRLEDEGMICKAMAGGWDITNLGAILFAKNISDFRSLSRKAVRVILYKGKSRIETQREQMLLKGYAAGFENLIGYIDNLLPRSEVVGRAFRRDIPIFPELAVRELVANALIHQDFFIRGTGVMVEIFSDRIEVTNPGTPLVKIERFLDSPPKSRNETLASFMRRIGVCEERGSGFDKVVSQTEIYQLPAPKVEVYEEHTRVILFSHKELKNMGKDEKIHACYLHSCLKYINRETMTNTSLRSRFGIEEKNSAIASRIIKDALTANLIKLRNPETSRKYSEYIPIWA